ncbi:MAG: sugar transferase [Henriciella sp.]|nr:sugar transferase [Hyphomonadaceae bacterium]
MRVRVSEDPMHLTGVRIESSHAEHITPNIDPLKRAFDIVVAATALVLLAPLILLFAILVRIQDGGKSIFAHDRYGLNGTTFKCYKLRSMAVDATERLQTLLNENPELRREWQATQKLKNDPRITPLGQFLRKSSIDELPQLWNVLRGDMSIVGPRPIVKNEIQKYGDSYRFYTAVRPGLTGLWQVEGRTETTYQERVEMDVRYVQTRSFWNDVWIVLKTIPAVIASRGAV